MCDRCTSQHRSLPTTGQVRVDLNVTSACPSIRRCPPLAGGQVKGDLSVTGARPSIGRCLPVGR